MTADNTESHIQQPAHLNMVETNPIDDVEQLLKEFEKKDKTGNDDDLGADETEGNLTRLVDKF